MTYRAASGRDAEDLETPGLQVSDVDVILRDGERPASSRPSQRGRGCARRVLWWSSRLAVCHSRFHGFPRLWADPLVEQVLDPDWVRAGGAAAWHVYGGRS